MVGEVLEFKGGEEGLGLGFLGFLGEGVGVVGVFVDLGGRVSGGFGVGEG